MDKAGEAPLPSPIRRVFYLANDEGNEEHEVLPAANPRVVSELGRCDAVVYGMGSLYTSICPTLCLGGMGETLAAQPVPKVGASHAHHTHDQAPQGASACRRACHVAHCVGSLICATHAGHYHVCCLRPTMTVRACHTVQVLVLNGTHDRETGVALEHDGTMDALDIVLAVCACPPRMHPTLDLNMPASLDMPTCMPLSPCLSHPPCPLSALTPDGGTKRTARSGQAHTPAPEVVWCMT